MSNPTQLPASEFPTPADSYICDNCGRDITKHLHVGRAHVQGPLGPAWYVCECGRKYPSGMNEWDNLSEWERRQRFRPLGLVFLTVLLLAFVALVYVAVTRRSIVLLALSVVAAFFEWIIAMLFVFEIGGVLEILRSIRRTRGGVWRAWR